MTHYGGPPVAEACPYCGQPRTWGHTCDAIRLGHPIHEHTLDYDATSKGRYGWCRSCLRLIRIAPKVGTGVAH